MFSSYGFFSSSAPAESQSKPYRKIRNTLRRYGSWMGVGAIAFSTVIAHLLIQWIFTSQTIAPDSIADASQVLRPGFQFLLLVIVCGVVLEAHGRQRQPHAQTQQVLKALAREKEKSEQLLLNILPATIAQELKKKARPIAHGYDEVTVMFADIVSFTPLSAQMSPKSLVKLLNLIFSAFDQLTEQHQLEKIKTIGDAYMVAGGLPKTADNHADAIVCLALEMQQVIAQISHETGHDLRLRIGIHTGPVVAGVIGIKKFSYDLWGDTVNVASRMESQGVDGGIQLSESTRQFLTRAYDVRSLGTTQIRGKGAMKTYQVR